MIVNSKVISTFIKNGFRNIKVLQFGPKTAIQSGPFGEDSNPLKDMSAIFADTSENGEPVIVGYVNKNQIAAIGEKRMFSLKEDGSISSFLWLKNNEEIHINGDTDFFVKFNPLNSSVTQLENDINAELTKIAQAISTLGGSYVVQPINADISQSKTEKIKTS